MKPVSIVTVENVLNPNSESNRAVQEDKKTGSQDGFVLSSWNSHAQYSRLVDGKTKWDPCDGILCDGVVCDTVCDGIVCDAICDGIVCDGNACDTICDSICASVCDNICDAISS